MKLGHKPILVVNDHNSIQQEICLATDTQDKSTSQPDSIWISYYFIDWDTEELDCETKEKVHKLLVGSHIKHAFMHTSSTSAFVLSHM